MLYQSPDGGPALSVRLQGQTAWLTQAQMAELFQTTPQNITMHIANVYADGELPEGATCKEYLQVRDGAPTPPRLGPRGGHGAWTNRTQSESRTRSASTSPLSIFFTSAS